MEERLGDMSFSVSWKRRRSRVASSHYREGGEWDDEDQGIEGEGTARLSTLSGSRKAS